MCAGSEARAAFTLSWREEASAGRARRWRQKTALAMAAGTFAGWRALAERCGGSSRVIQEQRPPLATECPTARGDGIGSPIHAGHVAAVNVLFFQQRGVRMDWIQVRSIVGSQRVRLMISRNRERNEAFHAHRRPVPPIDFHFGDRAP